jgi:hypothetical protein
MQKNAIRSELNCTIIFGVGEDSDLTFLLYRQKIKIEREELIFMYPNLHFRKPGKPGKPGKQEKETRIK